jgi:diacylglycerol kinase family enzyme
MMFFIAEHHAVKKVETKAKTIDMNPATAAPLVFVINAASGSSHAQATREVIEHALAQTGRAGQLRFSQPADLLRTAQQAAAQALASHTAVVAVGGDGTVNTVAQAAHAQGCMMGVVPQGTFNYFARTHGIPTDPASAVELLLHCQASPVQVATINEQVFLVNASLGLYPVLLEDREAYKARFGRSRLVALGAACVTLLRVHRQLRLHIELGQISRDVRTTTLFVGHNRLQLDQVGLQVSSHGNDPNQSHGSMAAVMVKPIGTLGMMRLMLHGAMGKLAEADAIESFSFDHMVVRPRLAYTGAKIKVAFDGEVCWMRSPIEFLLPSKPLYLLKPASREIPVGKSASDTASTASNRAGG